MDNFRSWGVLALRIFAILSIVIGLRDIVVNLIEALGAFDPTYFGLFFKTVLLFPLGNIVAGLVVFVLAKPLSRLAAPKA